MQLGYNTNGLLSHRLDDALALLADHGYEVVALTPDVAHLDPFHASAREVDAVARRLDSLGLGVVIETGARFVLDPRAKHEPTLMTPDPAAVARRLDFYTRCAAIGADLGARVVSFWSGVDRAPERGDAAARLREGVVAAVHRIRQAGLTPALEPEPGMAVETVADYLALREALGDAGPELTLDVGHLYATGEGEPADIVPHCAAHLAQVHLEDMRRGVHDHLPPGEGDVDFDGVARALRAGAYGGPVCFELSRSSHAAPDTVALCAAVWSRANRR